MLVAHEYVKEAFCLLHGFFDVAVLSLLRYEEQVLTCRFVVVVVLECAIDSFSALYLVANLLLVVVTRLRKSAPHDSYEHTEV